MDNYKELKQIQMLYTNKKISKEVLIGSVVSLILNKKILKSNIEVSDFIKFVFQTDMPLYASRSRTVMVAKICRKIFDSNEKEVQNYANKTYSIIKEILNDYSVLEKNDKLIKDKNNSLTNMSKWIHGIIRRGE